MNGPVTAVVQEVQMTSLKKSCIPLSGMTLGGRFKMIIDSAIGGQAMSC